MLSLKASNPLLTLGMQVINRFDKVVGSVQPANSLVDSGVTMISSFGDQNLHGDFNISINSLSS